MLLIWHTVLNGQFSHIFENKDSIFHMKIVSVMLLELNDLFGVEVGVLFLSHIPVAL